MLRIYDVMLGARSEEHTSELQSRLHLVCRLLLEKKTCSLEETLSRSYNADSEYGVVSCPGLLCFTGYLSPIAASKGPGLASNLLNRLGPTRLFHHPSSGGVRKIRGRFFSYGAIQIVPSSLVA